jgi:hypothetical protein
VAERWPAVPAASAGSPPPELLSLDVWLRVYDPAEHGWDHHCASHAATVFADLRWVWESQRGWVPGPGDVREAQRALDVASVFCHDCI